MKKSSQTSDISQVFEVDDTSTFWMDIWSDHFVCWVVLGIEVLFVCPLFVLERVRFYFFRLQSSAFALLS